MSEWWVQQQGRPSGPVGTDALVQAIIDGRVPPSILVCSVTPGSQWAPAQAIPGLARAIQTARAGLERRLAAPAPSSPQYLGQQSNAYSGPVQAGYSAEELPQAGYAPIAQKVEARQEIERPKKQGAGRAGAAMAFAAILAVVELGIFGASFVVLSFDQIWTFVGTLLLSSAFGVPFVCFCFYAWVTWGLAQYRAKAGRRGVRAAPVFGGLALAGGVLALIVGHTVLGIILLSSLVFFFLAWLFVRRARTELSDDPA